MTIMRNFAAEDAWFSAYEATYSRVPEEAHVPCPNCHADALRIFFFSVPKNSAGSVAFWCDNCMYGIWISRAPIPDGARVLPFQSAEGGGASDEVPDFVNVLALE